MCNEYAITVPVKETSTSMSVPYYVPQRASQAPSVEVSERALEARARRAARAAGFVLSKSRRGESVDNYGGFMIVDPSINVPVAGFRFDLTAEAVIDWCMS